MKYKVDFYGLEIEIMPKTEIYNVRDFADKPLYGIAVALEAIDKETECLEPFAMLTKSFGEFIGLKNAAYIDIDNCPFANQLLKYGIATDTGMKKQSGFCEYPLWQFNEDFLRESGSQNYEKYSRKFDEYTSSCMTDETELSVGGM